MFGLDPVSVLIGIVLGLFIIPIVRAKVGGLKAKEA